VFKVIGEALSVDPREISISDNLVDDIWVDDLDIINVVILLEQFFDVNISDDEIKSIIHVQDIVDLINNKT